jgi:threonine/homoserine/homoserine lactone efflux protein
VMPQFIPDGQPSFGEGLTLAAISVSIATAIHLTLVLLAEQARGVLMAEARARIVRRVLALAMLGVGVWFLAKALA